MAMLSTPDQVVKCIIDVAERYSWAELCQRLCTRVVIQNKYGQYI
jgi:hypothetical protein